jgi:two-component system, OmpR family, sensor kinase
MKRSAWAWLTAVCLPFLLGLSLSLLFELDLWPNQVYMLQFDLAGLFFRLGVGLSLLVAAAGGGQWWLRRYKQQIRQQEHQAHETMHRHFLRRLDHELKNPLTIIHLGLTNLQQSLQLSAPEQESLARVSQQAQRLQKLVVDLRWLADLEAGKIERQPVDLADVLAEAITLAREATHQPERLVTLQVQETPWPVSPVAGDRELLVLAFRNLVENALKFATASDRVEIRASENGQTAVVEIADSGPGIRPEEQLLIFENLYRSPDARGIPGSGLGLPLVQRVITLHGGDISLRSRPQAGTLFVVSLPLATPGK